MPSIQALRARLVTPENVSLIVATALSIVGAYTIQLRISAGTAAFFGLIVLGVSTPKTLTTHDLLETNFTSAVVRTGVACTATFVTYVGLLTVIPGQDENLLGAAVAFTLIAVVSEGVARVVD